MTVDRGATLMALSRHCRHVWMRLIDGSPHDMAPRMTIDRVRAAVVAVLLGVAVVAYWTLRPGDTPKPGNDAPRAAGQNAASRDQDGVDLSDSQLASVKVEPVEEREFPVEKDAVGSIGFNEDMTVQVFTPYQGRIIALFAEVGNDVSKGQTLFTIDSPDLLQAESTLIAAAGVLELNSKNLARLRDLFTTRAVSQHDVEQATSDQQTAEGNLQAARDSVRLFGKTDADIDTIIAKRSADPTLVVPSPINGRITARNAAPGLYVQPGNEPAPYTVADISTMWMLANVAETDSPAFRVGQPLQVKVGAFPGRVVDGKVSTIGAAVDANTRGVQVGELVATDGALFLSNTLATASR